MITNGSVCVAVGGVMGGLDSEVEDDTTDILLEAAYFDSKMIRKSRKHLKMVTESSTRFEKGADPNVIPYAIDRAACLLQDICGGEVLKGIVDCYPKKIEPLQLELRPERCNKVLGSSFSVEEMKKLLAGIDFNVEGDNPIKVTVPTFRPDIEREIDLIEEVVRMAGYDSIPDAIENKGPLFTPTHRLDNFISELRTLMLGAGFDEMIWHGLVDGKVSKALFPNLEPVKLANSSSEELNVMRRSTIISSLMVAGHNISHRNLDLAFFEVGRVYHPPENGKDFEEEDRLVMFVTGNTQNNWRENPRPYDFYDLAGVIDKLAAHFHWPKVKYASVENPVFEKDISFNIEIGGKVAGVIGKISGKPLKKFSIKQPVYIAEINLPDMIEAAKPLRNFDPLPIYPAAPRDLAMIVDETVKAGDLVALIKKTAGDIAESVDIFDLYTGKQIEKGKKSIAISITYRSYSRSLSSDEIDASMSKVMDKLKENFKAVIRDK